MLQSRSCKEPHLFSGTGVVTQCGAKFGTGNIYTSFSFANQSVKVKRSPLLEMPLGYLSIHICLARMFTDILTAEDLNNKFTTFLANLKADVGLSYFIRVLQQVKDMHCSIWLAQSCN
jgi:hypothetical protein